MGRFSFRFWLCPGLAAWLLGIAGLARGEEPGAADKDAKSKARLAVMQAAMDDLKLSSKDIDPESLKFDKAPFLRYDDATRDLLDAGVWRLGKGGRPRAVVTLEIYRPSSGQAKLTYEFVSLASDKFSAVSPRGPTWEPAESELKMEDLEGAPPPAETERARLVQLRQLARRFTAHEISSNNRVECRLLPQPLDRYSDSKNKIQDGAIFVFANGTNPELGLLLECHDKKWTYGAFRLSSARLYAELDGKQFYEVPWFNKYSPKAPYTAAGHPVTLP